MSLSYPIIINKSHYVGGSTYRYRFGTNVNMGDISVALGSCSVYYSWRNITATKSNNSFRITHPIAGTASVNLDLTIPDGGYEIADINNFIRWSLIQNGYYIQNNTTGEQVVYGELRLNASTYKCEWVSYPVPTSLPSGFTAGSAITFPSVARGPQLSVSTANFNFGVVIGFGVANYPAVQQATISTSSSTKIPEVSSVNNVVLTLSSAMNPFAPNSQVIHSFSQAGVRYGGLITSEPNELSFVPQQQGYRQELTIQLCDQMLQPIDLLDSDITIKLLLRKEDPNSLKY